MSTEQLEESGTFFLLPPSHRLFAVFDDPVVGSEVAADLREERLSDVWTFFGAQGARSVDPHVRGHGVPVAMVRVMQRALTNDCEYCDGLAQALAHGAMVLAVRVETEGVDDLSEQLRERGAHYLAYGEHWNFVPVSDAGHAIGPGWDEDGEAPA